MLRCVYLAFFFLCFLQEASGNGGERSASDFESTSDRQARDTDATSSASSSGSSRQSTTSNGDGDSSCTSEAAEADGSADDPYRGWYDVQGCGSCSDYCRWVGGTGGSGGNPANRLTYGNLYWSCYLAGSSHRYTAADYFDRFDYERCRSESESSSSSSSSSDSSSSSSSSDDSSSEDDEASPPGVVHWTLAGLLSLGLVAGCCHVFRALKKVDVVSIAMRNVPEGMRTAQCGACHTMQYISNQGRIFVCFSCQSANRVPRAVSNTEQQLLVTATGPLKLFEFRKGGDNYWQEIRQTEVPDMPEELRAEADKLHFKQGYCWGCAKESCMRLDEFESNQAVAKLSVLTETKIEIQPAVIGQPEVPQDMNPNVSHKSHKSNISYSGMGQCVVCLDGPGSTVLLPCAHGSVCEECATRIAQNRAAGGAHCPHCRSDIERLVKLTRVEGPVARGIELRIPIARAASSAAVSSPSSTAGARSLGTTTSPLSGLRSPLRSRRRVEAPGTQSAPRSGTVSPAGTEARSPAATTARSASPGSRTPGQPLHTAITIGESGGGNTTTATSSPIMRELALTLVPPAPARLPDAVPMPQPQADLGDAGQHPANTATL